MSPPDLTNLWLPIGPSTVLGGQSPESSNVTGRVRQLAVSPDGRRVYAVTAGGGVWYSADEGASWLVLGGWMRTPNRTQLDVSANALSGGSLVVDWDSTPGGESDTVYVGTGEISPDRRGFPGGHVGGVGVLRAEAPVPRARFDPFAQIWTREGEVMAGLGIYRLARNPERPEQLVAATSKGLYLRSVVGGAATWSKVTGTPFVEPPIAPESPVVTDVWWANAGGPAGQPRLWVAVYGRGVWFSDQAGGDFIEVALPERETGRLGLAASVDGSVVYVLGSGPRLWRLTGTTAKRVGNVPAALFGGGRKGATDMSGYLMAIAVHPADPNTVVIGGASVRLGAALFMCSVQDAAGAPRLNYDPANDTTRTPDADLTFIGEGVHADVHHALFAARGGDLDLWVACDGGVFRSVKGGRRSTWQARNNGLAVIEPGFLACHPTSDAVVVVGTQDNGVLERTGDTTWTYRLDGDGGGVAFHPAGTRRYLAQDKWASWRSNDGNTTSPESPGSQPDDESGGSGRSNFYSAPGVVAATNKERARVAVGTNRVWVSEDFGVHWYTVPTGPGSNPRAGKRNNPNQDVVYGATDYRSIVLACRWKDENELYVLCHESIQRFTRTPGPPVRWERTAVTEKHYKKSTYAESDIAGPAMPYLPPLGSWSDLAIHRPGPSGASTLYVACVGKRDAPKMDTLWWYDGLGVWHATGLHAEVKAPALAVAVHPADPSIVFVGTTLGVWKGTLSQPAGSDPRWTWQEFCNGLPEAAVQDLAFYHDPESVPPILLLRAALQSRGVWEVDLLAPCDEKTYLRVHPLDTRRRTETRLGNPMSVESPAGAFTVYASPDILIRPAPPAVAPADPPDPFDPLDSAHHNPGFRLWTFQTAFHQIEPACRPTGRWTPTFEALLVDWKNRQFGPGSSAEVDKKTWTTVVTQGRVYQPPWDGTAPSEADLLQLANEESRYGRIHEFEAGGQSIRTLIHQEDESTWTQFSTRRLKVDVLVHHRGLQQLQPPNVSVLLLVRRLSEPSTGWDRLPVDADWKSATESALTSGIAPARGWPDRWAIADPTPVRHPAGNVDASRPQAATFDVTLPAAPKSGDYLLLAVCSSVTARVSSARLVGTNLGELLLRSSHVAARHLALR